MLDPRKIAAKGIRFSVKSVAFLGFIHEDDVTRIRRPIAVKMPNRYIPIIRFKMR